MSSIVEQLQSGALDRSTQVSDLLRMAKVIAVKLDLPDLGSWVDHELNGYGKSEPPPYRLMKGQVKGKNPFHGWQPVLFNDNDVEKSFTEVPLRQPVAEIEHIVAQVKAGSGELMIEFPSEAAVHLRTATGMDFPFALVLSSASAWGVLNAVRTALLDWSLKLEKAGIKGDGMSFSKQEKDKAHQGPATYNIGSIGTFAGNLGSNTGTVTATINLPAAKDVLDFIETVKSNEGAIKVSDQEITRLNTALDLLASEMGAPSHDHHKVHQAVATIRNVMEGAVGSLVASGLLYELGKLFS